jgi:hypothetical protein
MVEPAEMRNFEEFWPFYVREHADETNRTLHFAGLTLAMGCVAAAALTLRPSFLVAAPVLGYGCAWIGHFAFEGNRPATFRYPVWSLRGDFVMWWKIVNGTMAEEVARVTRSDGAPAEAPAATPASQPN